MEVLETDLDALKCRMSATKMGYIDDPYIQYFLPKRSIHKPPIINRGTYVRTWSIDHVLINFLNKIEGKKQIISLGAGTDTRAFRFLAKLPKESIKFIELDLYPNCVRKVQSIAKHEALHAKLGDYTLDATKGILLSDSLDILPFDIRRIPEAGLPDRADRSLPTIVLSECCLCYLEPNEANSICQWFQERFSCIGILVYEPIQGMDSFGKMMKSNLASRGIYLKTLESYNTIEDQETRFTDNGFQHTTALDFAALEREWIPEIEKQRIAKIEMLDELEEWYLLAKHYCLVFTTSQSLHEKLNL
ncbi:leucine carboxyl methyltransferase, involved in regulation of PPA2 [Schizosaccharomyces osmophilus]|uniref:Leucine carboxyl methyltransferase 1 n=1 Tax=Schizosaccharomyces osmophilus TaxID=2545709 RepID=A0AAE9W7G6_9SCHI|nr:leucine carboxyl methyltransferase, involved in regulation of PPA2 [Schizosaccharomyces osmophilus]WBW70899.1 leucine carboxyl methyltransferase, involved in regulation of PPA2 [Schizosaccharomyces osmophilus]